MLALVLFLLPRPRKTRITGLLLWTATFLGVIAPWTLRNYHVHGQFVLVAANGGGTFYGGNNDRVVNEPRHFGYWLSTTELPHRDLIDSMPDEVAHDKMEWKLGIDWVRENPGKFIFASAFKVARLLLGLPDFDGGRSLYRVLRMVGYWPFMVLFLFGGVVCWQRRLWSPEWLVIHASILATLLTAVIFWGSPRFRDVNAPFLMVYAALGFELLRRRGAERRKVDLAT
jgi:hypothetical protein